MPDDEQKRAADTLEEIRDLLVEMRDAEQARAEETREQIYASQRLQEETAKRQKFIQLFAMIILVVVVGFYIWSSRLWDM